MLNILLAMIAASAAPGGPMVSAAEARAQALRTCVPPGQENRLMAVTEAEQRAMMACGQRAAVALIRERLPIQVDPITTLEAISLEGYEVSYRYRLAIDAPVIDADQLTTRVRRDVCGNNRMAAMMSAGGSYHYLWLDGSGRTIAEMTIDRCAPAAPAQGK